MHSGDSACVIPPLSIGPELEAEIRRQTELLVRGLGVQGLCNVAVRAARGHDLRARGEPAREPHGAVRVQGDGHRPRRPRLPGRRPGTTPRGPRTCVIPEPRGVAVKEVVLPVRALPGLRPRARPGDALDGRGHGARARLRHGLREGDARRRPAPARAAERAPRGRVPVGLRPRQAGRHAAGPAPAPTSASTSCATPGTARRIAQLGIEVTEVGKVGAGGRQLGRRPRRAAAAST